MLTLWICCCLYQHLGQKNPMASLLIAGLPRQTVLVSLLRSLPSITVWTRLLCNTWGASPDNSGALPCATNRVSTYCIIQIVILCQSIGLCASDKQTPCRVQTQRTRDRSSNIKCLKYTPLGWHRKGITCLSSCFSTSILVNLSLSYIAKIILVCPRV